MKLNKQITDVIKIGKTNSKQATISESKIGKLQYILTKGLYSDPITAVIAEITNNGIDSVVQSGKNATENPVLVEIDKDEQENYFFRVTDKGMGLIPWEFKNIVMNYLESTKENDNSSIGMFGLGAKSFLSLDRAATFTCRKNGAEWKFLAYPGTEFCEYDLISKRPTTEEDGVTFEIPIRDRYEKDDFIDKALQKLAYYDTVALTVDKILEENKIVRSENWQYSNQNTNDYLHLCLKDVYYSIDFIKLGIAPIRIPIALRFGLQDGLVVTPSRESLIYTEKVKKIILDKIEKVADWFVERYNKTVEKEYDSIIEVWNQMTVHDRIVEVDGIEIGINSIADHSKILKKSISIKGIKQQKPVWYVSNRDKLLTEYKCILYAFSGSRPRREKYILNKNLVKKVLDKEALILVNKMPLGYVRTYLLDKYKSTNLSVLLKHTNRKLKVKTKPGEFINENESYYHLLNLLHIPKKIWRKHIEEFNRVENEFKSRIIDETSVESSQDFQDWLVRHRTYLKANRVPSQSNYKALNKQNNEVTISIGRDAVRDDSLVLEKKVFKISELSKEPCMFVLFDNKLTASLNWWMFRGSNTLRVCMVGNKEIKKLPQLSKKFIKFEDFMTSDCKPFQRIASSILFNRAVADFNKIKLGRVDIFNQFLASYVTDSETLRKYVESNYVNETFVEIENAILEVAKEKDLFDKQLWDVYLRVKEAVSRFDFLTCLRSPQSWDTEAVKKYKRLINQMLLFQKKYYDLEGYELVKKSEPSTAKEVVVEEEELEEVF